MLFSIGQIIHAIHDLDADVISIETSRSHGDLIKDFEDINYDLGIGLGVYDIHSPRIPTKEEITTAIESFTTTNRPLIILGKP